MTNQPSGNTDQATNKPTSEHPSTVQHDLNNQGCPPIETFREPDLAPRPATSNSRTSSKSKGAGGGIGKFVALFLIPQGSEGNAVGCGTPHPTIAVPVDPKS